MQGGAANHRAATSAKKARNFARTPLAAGKASGKIPAVGDMEMSLRNGAPPLSEVRRMLGSPMCDREMIESLRNDPRAAVSLLLDAAERRTQRIEEETERHEEMLAIERQLFASGRFLIAGVDEAGIGPLAGPIVAAAVILGDAANIHGIDDVKKLDTASRSQLGEEIRERAACISIGVADVDEIDELNVYHAGLLAMRRAVDGLESKPDHVLVDARRIPDIGIAQSAFIRGDSRSLSIAAASIIAKTHRDGIMDQLDRMHPGYGFSRHKGYGTPEHQSALRRLGVSKAHRTSYEFVRELIASGRHQDD
jgi:ribonuclease HII